MRAARVQFKASLDGKWVEIGRLLEDVGTYVHTYLSKEHLTCCDLQAGFFIEIGGRPWNGPDSVDEYGNAKTWIAGLENIIIKGATEAHVWAWEESGCRMKRNGRILELEDVHHSGEVVCPQASTDLVAFAKEMIREARKWDSFARLMAEEIERLAPDFSSVEDKATLLEHVTVPGLRQRLALLEAKLPGVQERRGGNGT